MAMVQTSNGSAVPSWLVEILPQWFLDRPAFTEAAFAASKAFMHANVIIVTGCYGFALAAGKGNSIPDFIGYVAANWQGPFLMYIFGGGIAVSNGKNAFQKAGASEAGKLPAV